MPIVDLLFPVLGKIVTVDHSYALFSALSHDLQAVHQANGSLRIGTIGGQYAGNGLLHLVPHRSRLRLRLPIAKVPEFLPISGKSYDVAGHAIRLGVPQVAALVPAASLVCRTVTIKGFSEPEVFLEAARRQLDELKIEADIGIPVLETGPHAGRPRRNIVRIKGRTVIGFALQVTALSAEDSLKLQEHGLGGRATMGCGMFVPLRMKGAE